MDRILLSLKAENKGCFHFEYRAVEVRESQGRYFARVTQTYARENPFAAVPDKEVSAARVLALQEAVSRLLAEKDQNSGGKTTTVYTVRLERFVDGKSTVISTSSSAPLREELLEFAESPTIRDDLKRKLNEALAGPYHVWAHELYKIADTCVREWGGEV